ncbi:MAG: AAA family ATPase [Bacteroidales bacterium]|nr:AAA family ATPase [Candidatus Sodaliphilus limicaballi]
MKAIGFKNFRKFQEFPDIDLGGINILVGPNNSGKSSLIKALIWASININKSLFWTDDENVNPYLEPAYFTFTDNTTAHYRLGNFNVCVNKDSNSDKIELQIKLDDIAIQGVTIAGSTFILTLERVDENLEIARVSEYTIENKALGFLLSVNCKAKKVNELRFTFNEEVYKNLQYAFYENKLMTDIIKKLYNQSNKEESIFSEDRFQPAYNRTITPPSLTANKSSEKRDIGTLIWQIFQFIKDNFRTQIHYIEAHNAPHTMLINRNDKNDFLAQTLNFYSQLPSAKRTMCEEFAKKWLSKFDVCENFYIKPDETGEAFTVRINSGEHLAQKGTGSIQMFILVLRLATEIAKGRKVMMLIEEPEQNLHPKLQSLLADMFFEVYEKSDGRIQLVVETHSEYLVRKLQVIAAQNIERGSYTTEEVNENIKVMFFPENGCTYSMEFDDYGYFIRDFATGFFDEAGRSYRELVRMERGIK